MEIVKTHRRPGPPARYRARVVLMEEPEIVEKLDRSAIKAGHSVAAEIRAAVRSWLSAWESES